MHNKTINFVKIHINIKTMRRARFEVKLLATGHQIKKTRVRKETMSKMI